MAVSHSLPVLMPNVAQQRWACHSCGLCCRSLVGHLFPEEVARLDAQQWSAELGTAPYVRLGRGYVLNKRPDESCVFLDDKNLCKIHAKFGEAAKPLACRIFPFSVRPVSRGWQASFRFDCPSAVASQGKPISQYGTWLRELVSNMDHSAPNGEDFAELQAGLPANSAEIAALEDRLLRWIQDDEATLNDCVVGLGWLAAMLAQARLANVRGPRFVDLLDILFDNLRMEIREPLDPPSPRQLGLFRQLVFAHAEHVTHAEATGRTFTRLRRRWTQLRMARRFLKGESLIPRLPGLDPGLGVPSIDTPMTFQVPDLVAPSAESTAETHDLIRRYLTARLNGRTCYGEGYYGWPIPAGLGALALSLAVAGWIARYQAAQRRSPMFTFADLGQALGIVDRAATRLPSLGKTAERIRVAYLCRDHGVARLLRHYSLGADVDGHKQEVGAP